MANLTIENIMSLVDAWRPGHPYLAAHQMQWINEVEGYIWKELFEYKTPHAILRENGISAYDLPEGVEFKDVTNVYVDGEEIFRIDCTFKDTTGYYRGSDGKLNIYPMPTEDDTAEGLEVIYLTPFTRHTESSETVYVEAPYEKMYYEYNIAKADFNSRKYSDYNNMVDAFNNTFSDYINYLEERKAFIKDEARWNLLKQRAARELLKKIKI
jgi:hypothetical protein